MPSPGAPATPPYTPLARTLIRRIVALAVLCMMLTGGLKASLAYRDVQQGFEQAVRTVAENSLQVLSGALWDIEVDAVQRRVDWLATLPEVGRVRVEAVTGQVFASDKLDHIDTSHPMMLDILAPTGGRLGQLEIWPNHGLYTARIAREVLAVIFDYVLFTTLICLAVSWILRRELQRPLQQIARFASSLKPNQLAQPLVIDRRHHDRRDEIDLVVAGFQQLQADLRHHIETLDQTVEERTRQLNDLVNDIQRLSITDALTGCYNRRLIEQRLPAEMERSHRYRRPLAVVFVDIDHFKPINDRWGHAAGDEVLREIGRRLLGAVRSQVDWIARYGGEEFLIVLPERSAEDARQLAERLRALVEATPIALDAARLDITASLGVAEYAADDTLHTLLNRADAMLYKAKESGRNRVLVAGQPV